MFALTAAQFSKVPASTLMPVAALAALLWSADAIALNAGPDDDAIVVAAADTPRAPRPQFEVSTSSIPRFDNIDGNTQTARIDMRLLSSGRNGVGVALGMNNATGALPGQIATLAPSRSVDLGLHWRHTFDSNYRFDVTAYRRMPNADAMSLIESRDPTYGARMEMGFGSTSARKGFVADRGFVGLQLEGDARVGVKRKNGGPMFYYRNSF